MRMSNSFILSLLTLAAEVTLAWFGKPTGAATVVAGLYIGARAGQKVGMVYSSSKDPQSNTDEIINQLK